MATTDTLQLQGPLSAVLPVRHSTGLGRARQWQPQRQSRRTRAGCDRNSFVSEHKASSGTAELQRQAEKEKLLCSPSEPARYKRGDCLQHGAGSHRISAPCQRPPIAYEKLKDAKRKCRTHSGSRGPLPARSKAQPAGMCDTRPAAARTATSPAPQAPRGPSGSDGSSGAATAVDSIITKDGR